MKVLEWRRLREMNTLEICSGDRIDRALGESEVKEWLIKIDSLNFALRAEYMAVPFIEMKKTGKRRYRDVRLRG